MKTTLITLAISFLVFVGYAQQQATSFIHNPYIIANNELTNQSDIIQRYNQINSVDAKPNPYFDAYIKNCSYYTIQYKNKTGLVHIIPANKHIADLKKHATEGAHFKAHGGAHSEIKGYPGLYLETYKEGANDVAFYFLSQKDMDNGITINISNPTLNKYLIVHIWINLNNGDRIKLAKDFIRNTQFK